MLDVHAILVLRHEKSKHPTDSLHIQRSLFRSRSQDSYVPQLFILPVCKYENLFLNSNWQTQQIMSITLSALNMYCINAAI